MIAVIQRVLKAQLHISNNLHSEIGQGLLVLLGITHTDTDEDITWLASKLSGLRIFGDEDGKMNLDVKSIDGEVLLVSQFTLHASTKKGNRPSFIDAAAPEIAIPIYNNFIQRLTENLGKQLKTGVFGADMQISLVNDGPVTIVIDTKNRK